MEEEGNAFEKYLEKRKHPPATAFVIKHLILLVLRCYTMIFNNRCFHQICHGYLNGSKLSKYIYGKV